MITPEDIAVLKKVRKEISRMEVIQTLNRLEVDYFYWDDFKMYIYYLENCVVEPEDES